MGLKEKLKAALEAQKALVMAAIEDGRGLTEEEQTQVEAYDKEIVGYEKAIEAEARVNALEEAHETPVDEPVYAQPKSHKEIKLFNSLGEQLSAIANASTLTPGATPDARLLEINAAASGLNESVPADGGFALQPDLVAGIIDTMYDTSDVMSRCQRIPVSRASNGIKLLGVDETNRGNGYRRGGVTGYWADEAGTVTASKPKFREISLSLNKLMGIGYATEELLQDAPAMSAFMGRAFQDEMIFKTSDAVFNGTGAGQPLGFLNSGALVSIAKETGQAAATIQVENLVKMYSRMPARSRQTAVWFINQEIEPQLFTMALSVGTGGVPIYMPPNGLSDKPFGTIFGRPVIPVEYAAALGTVGDINFVDLSQYLVADKATAQAASSIHVRFLYDEMAFRITYRVDGQPILASAITPYKGSATQSPFVALATRS